jgi:hypothetical protein
LGVERALMELPSPLMNYEDIANYLKVSVRTVRDDYCCLPSFPAAVKLPTPKGRTTRRWKVEDIVKWAESLIPKKPSATLR